MNKKLISTIIAISICLTFSTAAFAGLLNILLGLPTQLTQEQIEKFHVDYLNKVAAKIKQTGDQESAFQDVINEQKKMGYTVNVVQNDSGQIKSFDVSGKDLPVVVKSTVDRQQQLMTVSYTDLHGNPKGAIISKRYELPEGSSYNTVSNNTNNIVSTVDITQNKNTRQEANSERTTENSNNVGPNTPTQKAPAQTSNPFAEGAICAGGKVKIIKGFQYSNVAGSGILDIWCTMRNVSPQKISRIFATVKVKDKEGTTVGNGSCQYGFGLAPGETAIVKGNAVVQSRDFNGIQVLITDISAY